MITQANSTFQRQNIQAIINSLIANKNSILYKPESMTLSMGTRYKYKNIEALKEAAYMKAHNLMLKANNNFYYPLLYSVNEYKYPGIERGAVIDPKFTEKKEPCPASGCTTIGSFGCWLATWKYYSGKSKTETPQLKPCAL